MSNAFYLYLRDPDGHRVENAGAAAAPESTQAEYKLGHQL